VAQHREILLLCWQDSFITSSREDTWLSKTYRIYDFCDIAAGMLKHIMQLLEEDALQLPRDYVFRKDPRPVTLSSCSEYSAKQMKHSRCSRWTDGSKQ
jgi:hypothetical protein